MPHTPKPVTNTSAQMTAVEPTIRMPAWRSDSPKKRSTRPPQTSRTMLPVKRPISPVVVSHSRGSASSSFIAALPLWPSAVLRHWLSSARRSLDHEDVGVGGEQRLGEYVVERADPQERDHDRLVDRAPHPLGAAGGRHALVAADDRD